MASVKRSPRKRCLDTPNRYEARGIEIHSHAAEKLDYFDGESQSQPHLTDQEKRLGGFLPHQTLIACRRFEGGGGSAGGRMVIPPLPPPQPLKHTTANAVTPSMKYFIMTSW